MVVDHPQHRSCPGIEWAVGPIGLKLVILDEVDPGLAKCAGQGCRLLRPEADAGLDDGADQRPPLHTGKPAGTLDSEPRAGIGVGEGAGQPDVEQAQP
jgi:hypothetical protein